MDTLYKYKQYIFIFLLVCCTTYNTRAITNHTIKPFERKAFIENKGQLKESLPAQFQNFAFCIDNNSQILFTKKGLTHIVKQYNHKKLGALAVFMSEEKREGLEHEVDIKTQYISLEWLNANPNVEIEISGDQPTSYNYVMRPEGKKPYTEMCKGYSKLTYKNLYNGIDVEYFFTEKDGFKYNLIMSAGADISQVKMQYSGDVKLVEKEGNIIIKTLKGDIIDHAPISYLATNSNESINSSFNLKDNIVSFIVNNPTKQAVIIDPWTSTPTSANPAYDNGVDVLGNVYLYGGASPFIVEKYNPSGTSLIWSLSNGTTSIYYGDMLVESTGNFYLSEGFSANGAQTYKYAPNSTLIWASTFDPNYREHWRISLNCVTNQVIVVGGGTTAPTDNIAQIDVNTGVLTNVLSFYGAHDDMSGLCVDIYGKSYVHGGISNTIVFTNTSNNSIGSTPSGYNQSEIGISTPSYYPTYSSNGYNMMTLGGTTFLFTTDGATLKKWDRNTFALLGSVSIPGGSQNMASGILSDNCNNVFVGSTNGVYRYDFTLNQKEYQPTSGAVYDIAYSPNSDIIACGAGFFADLAFGRETCGSLQTFLSVNPCNPNINTVTVRPIQSNTSIPPYSFLWDDGNTDSTRTNLSPGKHTVTIKDGSCIPQFTKDTIVIVASAPLTITKVPSCFNTATGSLQVNIGQGQHIVSYSISPAESSSLLNDSTIKATAVAAGIYTFHVVSSAGCSFDSTITLTQFSAISVTTHSLSVANCPGQATGSGQANASGSVPYTSSGHSPYTYSWATFPIQTTSIVSNVKEGVYIVTIKDSLGCSVIDSVTIFANSNPQANFLTSTVCPGFATSYTDQSTPVAPSTSSVTTWAWDFTHDGIIDNQTQNPTNTFTAAGTFTTSLVVSDTHGCKDSVRIAVTVYPKPSISFSANPVCFGTATTFVNTSTIAAPDNVTNWDWSFGEVGNTSTTQNPSYTYTTTSNLTQNTIYHAQLLAISNHGCKDSLSNTVTVYSLPTALFKSDSVCLHQTSHLTDISNGNGNSLTAYHWDVTGDNVSDLSGTPTSYIFTSTGNNTVNYTVSTTPLSGLTCTNHTTQAVYVYPLPNPVFTFSNTCINTQPNTFSAINSTISSGTNILYLWNYGDGQTGTGITTNHTYNTPQNYLINLTVISNKGCIDSLAQTITIYPKPSTHIVNNWKTCLGSATTFTATTLAGSGNIINWQWDVNNSINTFETTGQNSTYTYQAAGSETLALVTSTDKGCKDTTHQVAYVNYPPQVSFTMNSPTGCSPHCVGFIASLSGVTPPAQLINWKWYFGDGKTLTSSTSNTTNYCYTNNSHTSAENFNIKLVITSDSSCVDSMLQNSAVSIYPNPLADFDWNSKDADVLDATIDFVSHAIGASGPKANFWNFGDIYSATDSSNNAYIANPKHNYTSITPNNYHVTQVVTNIYGCKDSVTEIITIKDAVTFYIPNSFTPNGDGINEEFKGTGIGVEENTFNLWIFDRWGLLLFHSDQLEKGWDGTINRGSILQEDVYVWKVSFRDKLNKSHNYNGTVTLVK